MKYRVIMQKTVPHMCTITVHAENANDAVIRARDLASEPYSSYNWTTSTMPLIPQQLEVLDITPVKETDND